MALTRCRLRCLLQLSHANAAFSIKRDSLRSVSAFSTVTGIRDNLSVRKTNGLRSYHRVTSTRQKDDFNNVDHMLPPEDPSDIKDLVPLDVPFNDPEKGELVYYGLMTKQVRGIKIFSLSTTVIAGGLQPYFYLHADKIAPAFKFVMSGLMTLIMFGTPILIHFITKSHVISMYYNSDTELFTATTYNIILRKKVWKFKAEDVTFPDLPGPFTYMKVHGKSLNLDPTTFFSRPVFAKLNGFDKPMDWNPLNMSDFNQHKKQTNVRAEQTSETETTSHKDKPS